MPKLIIKPGTPQAQEFELKPGKNYVGRAFANDLKLEDPSVSGSHAQILVDGNLVTICDLGSTNGTFVNRLPVTQNALQPGQVLRFGGVEALFVADAAHGITTAPPTAGAPVAMLLPAAAPSLATEFTLAGPSRVGVAPQPVTVASSVKLTISHAAAAPPPVPIPAPAIAASVVTEPPPPPVAPTMPGVLAEPPPGKTVCKFHKNTPGQWLCQKCRQLFCSLCVSMQPTPAGAGYFCRTCGTQCVQVKIKAVAKKEKKLAEYSDGTILLRVFGFGLVAAVVCGGLWIGLAMLMGFPIPALFAVACGAGCGYAVKIASQDRPGGLFIFASIVSYLLAVVIGEIGVALILHMLGLGMITYAGVAIGVFLAFKIGGGDF